MNKLIIVIFKVNNSMKNKILIFSFLLFTCIFKAQVSDTLAYVKSFEANKINYINQSFSKLLNNMNNLQPIGLFTNTRYYSVAKFSIEDKWFDKGNVNMVIFWQAPIPETETEYYENKNHFYFTNDERSFYGNKIVKDIYVYTTK
ncbi:hypothetical protein [Chryseobacterium mulctrae]|uniref:hypothetical protein n=1 Tax=Chryseobacterium mulctrae TaxID=2576777 RepID=UPI00111721CD|nr:hypothetical protein [Chryseobacterium mulctrae]